MKKSKLFWRISRTLLFLFIGLNYTILLKTEAVGSWRNYLGYVFLIIALIDTVLLIKYFINKRKLNGK